MMPHLMDHFHMGMRLHDSRGEFEQNNHVASMHRGEDYGYAAARSSAGTPTTSTLATFTQIPQQTYLNLPTPVSSISDVFESPQRTSPSSSISSSHSITTSQVGKTTIAELEDTSPGNKLLEMEDTSGAATRTSGMSSRASGTSRALVAAIDRQLANLEQENLQLRNALKTTERNLNVAKQTAKNTHIAHKAVLEALADRECKLDYKNSIIAGLEKEVEHCRRHHLPPPPPSKLEKIDPPLSRFNPDARRASLPTKASPKPTNYRASSKPTTYHTAPNTTRVSPEVLATGPSYPLPSAVGSFLPKSVKPANLAPSPNPYIPLSNRSLSTTVAPLTSNTGGGDEGYDTCSDRQFTPLGFERPTALRETNPLSMHPVEVHVQGVDQNRRPANSGDIYAPLNLLSSKSSPDLKRRHGRRPSIPKSIALNHIQAQSQTSNLHSAMSHDNASYSPTPSLTSFLCTNHAQSRNEDRTRNRREEPPPVPKISGAIPLPNGVSLVNSSLSKPDILSAPPTTTNFFIPTAPGALSTLPSQVRARANSCDRPCRGSGGGQAQNHDPRQRGRDAASG